MGDVATWLREHGLGQYAGSFSENDVEFDLLSKLTTEDLKDLGLTVGHRRRFLEAAAALAELRGTHVPEPPTTQDEHVPRDEAERRQLTVMFCDLVGSTELAQRLDPEDLREVMRAFQDKCAGAISRFGGFIARYMGDGLLVYFGFPQAHEDEAGRAVRSGLDIVTSIAELNADLGASRGVHLSVRVGIATGLVVVGDIVGDGAAAERAVVGDTPNLAARLEALARPNQVLVSSATRSLLADRFDCEDAGRHSLKGLAQPVQVWRVLGERGVEGASRPARSAGALPIVGRQEELGLLLRAWEASKEGHGQVVLVAGEPGIGKSRLIEALGERVEGEREERLWTTARCSPYHAQSALYPVIEQLKSTLRWSVDDPPEERLTKLEEALSGYSFTLEETVPLFAALLSLPLPQGRYPASRLTPQQQRQMTLDAMAAWLLEEAERRPVLQLWEDIHWADPSTLELLELFIEQAPTAAMLNVLTFRPDFSPPWPARSHMTPITLSRLEQAEVEAIIANLAGGKALPDEVVEHIVAKADGVPLYVEELTKSILESGQLEERKTRYVLTGSLADVRIPATLQDTLMSRLDRLPTIRELAQLGAVLGREFAYEMLRTLSGMDEPRLRDGLGKLVAAELLYQRGRPPRARYTFKHALIQEAAYQSLLKRSRQQFHRQAAELLEERFAELVSTQPELVAHHYTEANCPAQAVGYWHRAGLHAFARFANNEAATHLARGLELLEALPATHERDRLELEMQMTLGPAVLAGRSFTADGIDVTYGRARELSERLGDRLRTGLCIRGQQIYHFVRGKLVRACEFGEQLVAFAERERDDALLVGGSHALGQSLFMLGRFAEAREVLARGIDVLDDRDMHLDNWPGGQPGEQCHLYASLSSWMLGYPDQAKRHAEQALVLSKSGSTPISLLNTELFVAITYLACRDFESSRKHAEQAIALAREYRHPTFHDFSLIVRGSTLAMTGRVKEGLDEMRRATDSIRTAGMVALVPFFLSLQAQAHARLGQFRGALDALREAADVETRSEDRAWHAEIKRIEGEVLAAGKLDAIGAADACLAQALETARAQQAKSFELRALMSVVRLNGANRAARDAQAALAETYRWFTEGFDTADLREAKALIEDFS